MNQNLSIVELNNVEIRRGPNGEISILDYLRVAGDYAPGAERKAWARITKKYPEFAAKCHGFTFPGKGQQKTPVTDLETILRITAVLPSTLGKKFREESARLVLRYLEGDATLAEEIIDRNDNPEDLNRIAERAKARSHNKMKNFALSQVGVSGKGISICTGNTYRGLFGANCSAIKKQKGLPAKANLRDHLQTGDLALISFAEFTQGQKIVKELVREGKPKPESAYYSLCYDVAKKVKDFVDNI